MSLIAIPEWAMGHSLYIGGVLGPDNKMYFVPKHTNYIAVLATNTPITLPTSTQSLFSSTTEELLTPSNHRFCTNLLVKNGRIYFIPDIFSCSMVLTPSAGNSVLFIRLNVHNPFEIGVLLANGSTVFIPKVFADDLYTFSTTTHTCSKLSVTVPNKPTSSPQNMQEARCCRTVTL